MVVPLSGSTGLRHEASEERRAGGSCRHRQRRPSSGAFSDLWLLCLAPRSVALETIGPQGASRGSPWNRMSLRVERSTVSRLVACGEQHEHSFCGTDRPRHQARPGQTLDDEYFDTLAWVAYRAGNYSEGLHWMYRISAQDSVEGDIRAYHLYFLLRGLGTDPGVQQLIRDRFQAQSCASAESLRVLADDDSKAAAVDAAGTRALKLPFRTRSAAVVMTMAFGSVLYPWVFFGFLRILGWLVALIVLLGIVAFLRHRLAEATQQRKRRRRKANLRAGRR